MQSRRLSVLQLSVLQLKAVVTAVGLRLDGIVEKPELVHLAAVALMVQAGGDVPVAEVS